MKKSQLKQSETISILVVFFILIFVSLIIYTGQRTDKIEKQMQQQEALRAAEIATQAYLLSEIQCSESQCIGCTGAMDILKLDAVSNNSDAKLIYNSTNYFRNFGYATIKVQIYYPNETVLPDDINHNWTIYNITRPEIHHTKRPHFIPVNIYNPFKNECYFGVMEVAAYS